ncbi:MAG: hypothetical protein LKCHEGNO_03236 [Burkholderiaceae bacterium]|nr:hypothetical protein [Burkholderiaceae bacterium]
MHLDQRRVVEARQQLGLVDERAEAEREGFRMRGRQQRHLLLAAAPRQRAGHVFLDRDLALQREVERAVDDAEATAADHPAQLELVQAMPRRQRVGGVGAGAAGGRGVVQRGRL